MGIDLRMENPCTVCYIKCGDSLIMMNRDRKEHDVSHGRWLGIGGKIEEGQSPLENIKDEVKDETGLNISEDEFVYKGSQYIGFMKNKYTKVYVFYAEVSEEKFRREFHADDREGKVELIKEAEVSNLNLWEGDRWFIENLHSKENFRVGFYMRNEDDKIIFDYEKSIETDRDFPLISSKIVPEEKLFAKLRYTALDRSYRCLDLHNDTCSQLMDLELKQNDILKPKLEYQIVSDLNRLEEDSFNYFMAKQFGIIR